MSGPPAAARHSASLIVWDVEHQAVWGFSRNISKTGLLLDARFQPECGSVRTIELVWGWDRQATATRVARHTPEGVAVSFVEPDPPFAQMVEEILSRAPPSPCGLPDYARRYAEALDNLA